MKRNGAVSCCQLYYTFFFVFFFQSNQIKSNGTHTHTRQRGLSARARHDTARVTGRLTARRPADHLHQSKRLEGNALVGEKGGGSHLLFYTYNSHTTTPGGGGGGGGRESKNSGSSYFKRLEYTTRQLGYFHSFLPALSAQAPSQRHLSVDRPFRIKSPPSLFIRQSPYR